MSDNDNKTNISSLPIINTNNKNEKINIKKILMMKMILMMMMILISLKNYIMNLNLKHVLLFYLLLQDIQNLQQKVKINHILINNIQIIYQINQILL